MTETSEQRNQRFRALRESIADQLLAKYPNVTFNRDKYGIDIFYYVTHFSDKIYVEKRKRGINNTVFSLDSYYLTEEEARKAISEHIPAAQKKFERCLKAFNKLKESLEFDVSYSITGDTHGIEDHPYIWFKMGGFEFQFTIEQ
jgi:hypothetical protein